MRSGEGKSPLSKQVLAEQLLTDDPTRPGPLAPLPQFTQWNPPSALALPHPEAAWEAWHTPGPSREAPLVEPHQPGAVKTVPHTVPHQPGVRKGHH